MKEARKIQEQDREYPFDQVELLQEWPQCQARMDITQLRNHAQGYRLRLGRYRVLFDVEETLQVIAIEYAGKRDERTY